VCSVPYFPHPRTRPQKTGPQMISVTQPWDNSRRNIAEFRTINLKKFLILHKIVAELRVGRKIVMSGHINRIFREQFSCYVNIWPLRSFLL
jgi:hypothetical protein